MKTSLPLAWKDLYDWCYQRHQNIEAFIQADTLWNTIAPLLLDAMSDAEVEQFAHTLAAESGMVSEGGVDIPDITVRDFPRCLATRLKQIARQKKWAERHPEPAYRIVDARLMIALHVDEQAGSNGQWKWEIICENWVDSYGHSETSYAAWNKVCQTWNFAQHRLRSGVVLATGKMDSEGEK